MKLQCPHCDTELNVEVTGLVSRRTIKDAILDACSAFSKKHGESPVGLLLGSAIAMDLCKLNLGDLGGDEDMFSGLIRNGPHAMHKHVFMGLKVVILEHDPDTADSLLVANEEAFNRYL